MCIIFSNYHQQDTVNHIQLLGFIPMTPFKYVHCTFSLVLLLLAVISFLFILISSLVHHTPVQVRPQDHDEIR